MVYGIVLNAVADSKYYFVIVDIGSYMSYGRQDESKVMENSAKCLNMSILICHCIEEPLPEFHLAE